MPMGDGPGTGVSWEGSMYSWMYSEDCRGHAAELGNLML